MAKDGIKSIIIGPRRIGGQPMPDTLPIEIENHIADLGKEIQTLRALKCPPISDGDTCICPIVELEEKLATAQGEVERLKELLGAIKRFTERQGLGPDGTTVATYNSFMSSIRKLAEQTKGDNHE